MAKNKRAQCLTTEQARTFIKAAKGHDLEALFTVALATGMRKGELLALHWPDIDVETGRVYIHQTLSCRGDLVASKCERTLVLPSLLLTLLEGARLRQIDLVFCKSQGQTFDPTRLHQFLADLLEVARLPPLSFHGLRCSTISLLISLGVPIQVIEMLLGFSHTSTILESSFPLPTHPANRGPREALT